MQVRGHIGLRAVTGIAAACLAGAALAQSAARTPINVPGSAFREALAQSAPTSGAEIVGFIPARLATPTQRQGQLLTVWGLRPSPGFVCVRIVSSSSLYTARFEVPTPAGDTVATFRLPPSQLADGAPILGGLAVVAFQADTVSCSTPGTWLATSWGDGRTGFAGALAVNSFRADEAWVRWGQSGARQPCQRLSRLPETAGLVGMRFDLVCPLTPPERCSDTNTVYITARDGRTYREPQQLDFRRSCPGVTGR